jgi:ABC-type sugar transport system ATPase subunit
MASISLRNVEKRYDDVPVLRDCNLDIRDREFVVLVGPSGSGKTTLLRIIAGLEHVSAGELRFDDVRVNEVDVGDRDIAMVFQNYGLYPHMSVYDNMAFGLRRRKLAAREIDRRVRSTAAMLDIEPFLNRRPRQLSGGQRQRVALGRAIVRDPAVFLLDEPLSNPFLTCGCFAVFTRITPYWKSREWERESTRRRATSGRTGSRA